MQSLRVTLLKTPVVGMVSMRSMSIASRQLPFLRPVNLQQPTRSMSILGGISDFASKKMENSKGKNSFFFLSSPSMTSFYSLFRGSIC